MVFMTLGRPRKFDENTALEAATNQFWAAGYEATSLQDLLKSMSLSKSSLYETFGNKRTLFIRCIRFYESEVGRELDEISRASRTSRELLDRYLNGIVEEASFSNKQRKGCLFVNTTNEISLKDKDIAKAVERGTVKMANVFASAIERDIQSEVLSKSLNVDDVVNYLLTAIAGVRTMVKSGADKTDLDPVIKIILKIVE